MLEKCNTNVLIVGCGEVGRAFGQQVERAGVDVTFVDPCAKAVKGMQTIIRDIPSSLPDNTLVLGAIPSSAALTVAQGLSHISNPFVYIDLSSSPMDLMQDCADVFRQTNVHFVDAAIMGSVHLSGSGAPICLSGPHAPDAKTKLAHLGFDVHAMPGSKAGDASGLKLLRTLMTKGIEALAIECFSAAQEMGLQREIRASLTDISARPFPELLDAMVHSHLTHAPRRHHEIKAALDQVSASGLSLPVNQAVLEAFRKTSNRLDHEPSVEPDDVEQALDWLRSVKR